MADDFPYVLTGHAATMLAEREIPLAWVARVLAAPVATEADSLDPELRHALARVPEHGNRMLRVIYNPQTQPWRIVTVYFDRRASRQL